MSERYFGNFPQIYYNNKLAVDITKRVRFSDTTRRIPTAFYNYEVKAGHRADVVSNAYYEDPMYTWLIYYANEIIDPYYQWYLSEDDFERFIAEKYGSFEYAQQKVQFMRLNWATDDQEISPHFYDNNLGTNLQKYFSPVFGQGTKVISYKRKYEDITCNTNKIVSFTVVSGSETELVGGQLCTISAAGIPVGSAEVVRANSTVVVCQHVFGNTSNSNTIEPRFNASNAVVTIIDSDILQLNIPDDEIVYWDAVKAYDWEQEKNEERKIIKLLDGNYASDASNALRQKLKE